MQAPKPSVLRHLAILTIALCSTAVPAAAKKFNVLFMISDDLTAEALGCYGNEVCQTPHIDALAAGATRYTRAYCQYPVCGPSRASLMFSYYPHTTDVFGYVSGRSQNGDRESWTQYFRNRGYYAARVSKIFHMGVPRGIQRGDNGSDDALSWTERFNSQGPEAEDAVPLDPALNGGNPTAERLAGINEGQSGVNQIIGGNTYEYVIVPDDDASQSDGKTARKACELLEQHKDDTFFLAVGFVRPHIPFVAPKRYFDLYPWQTMVTPSVPAGDQGDIFKKYVTSASLKFNEEEKKKSIAGYYASVSYMDAQVGAVMQKLESEGLADNTIVIFTGDHGFFLGEHDFWSKQYVHEESARVPLIIRVPGKAPALCHSFAELVDLFPTTAELCGLRVPSRLQGKSLAATLDDPAATVRDAAFTVMGSNTLYCLRSAEYAFIQGGATGSGGYELYDMINDPFQYTNLAPSPAHAGVLDAFKARMAENLRTVEGHRDDHTLWLPFNTTAGTTVADANGTPRGTLVGFDNPDESRIPGKHNMAVAFDGIDDHIAVSGFTPPADTSDRTVSAWIRTSDDGVICNWGSTGTPGGGWEWSIDGAGRLHLDVGDGHVTGTTPVADNQWHFVAAVLDNDGTPNASDVVLYVDGQPDPLSASAARAIHTGTSGLVIGGGNAGPSIPEPTTLDGTSATDGSADFVVTGGGVTMTVTPTSTEGNPATIGANGNVIGVTGGIGGTKADVTVSDTESLVISFDQDVRLQGWDGGNCGSDEETHLTSTAFDGLAGVAGATYNDATDSLSTTGTDPITLDDNDPENGILVPAGTAITFTVGSGHTVSLQWITILPLGGGGTPSSLPALEGIIDELRVDSRALPASEILARFQATGVSSGAWRLEHYGQPGAFDWNADLDCDGDSAFREYAFGSDPHDPASVARGVAQGYNPATKRLEATFTRRKTGTHDLSYDVGISRDLIDWTLPSSVKSIGPDPDRDPDLFEEIVVESSAGPDEEPRLFLRIGVHP